MITLKDAIELKRNNLKSWFKKTVEDYVERQGWDLNTVEGVTKLNSELDNLSRGLWK